MHPIDETLKQISLFTGLPGEALGQLRDIATEVHYEKDEIVFS